MTKRLCIVAHFDSPNFFQWYEALRKYQKELGIELSSVHFSATHCKLYQNFADDPYWSPIKKADYVFVYATRRSLRNEPTGSTWWLLPKFVKAFMKKGAKMVCQYDDEFQWLFEPNHVWWDVAVMPNPDNHGGPEQFFKDTGILEIPDAHFAVTSNPPFLKYTKKPFFKMLLPQLFRYRLEKCSEKHEGKTIGILIHSVKQASISVHLENVIRPNNWAVSIFTGSLDDKAVDMFREETKLPVNSEVYHRMEYEDYEDLLWRECSIGLDDNVGYHGWSRFAMECAIAYIPCVGSTESMQDIFPELYTAPQDYAKQIELINKLKTDKAFYHKMAKLGHDRVVKLLDDKEECKVLISIFEKIQSSESNVSFKDIPHYADLEYKPDRNQAHPHP